VTLRQLVARRASVRSRKARRVPAVGRSCLGGLKPSCIADIIYLGSTCAPLVTVEAVENGGAGLPMFVLWPSRLCRARWRPGPSHPIVRRRCSADVPSSADADAGLHQRVDPLGQPQQRGAPWTMQRDLVAAVQQGVTQLRKAAFDETALKEPEAA
jgi:hypothetical protein